MKKFTASQVNKMILEAVLLDRKLREPTVDEPVVTESWILRINDSEHKEYVSDKMEREAETRRLVRLGRVMTTKVVNPSQRG